VARHPALAEAHDLLARVQSDLGDGEAAFDAWMDALQADSGNLGAHKGLGFLYFRAGDLPRALRHLELAREQSDDAGLDRAIARVREALAHDEAAAGSTISTSEPADVPFSFDDAEPPSRRTAESPGDAEPASDAELFRGLDGARDGLLLLDNNGLRLGGGMRAADNRDVSDTVAAHLAGVSREAARTARLLDLGRWQSVVAECSAGNIHLSAPTADTLLLTRRDASVPAGRLAVIADHAAAAARRWLERVA
jgi:hypothetical protein